MKYLKLFENFDQGDLKKISNLLKSPSTRKMGLEMLVNYNIDYKNNKDINEILGTIYYCNCYGLDSNLYYINDDDLSSITINGDLTIPENDLYGLESKLNSQSGVNLHEMPIEDIMSLKKRVNVTGKIIDGGIGGYFCVGRYDSGVDNASPEKLLDRIFR